MGCVVGAVVNVGQGVLVNVVVTVGGIGVSVDVGLGVYSVTKMGVGLTSPFCEVLHAMDTNKRK